MGAAATAAEEIQIAASSCSDRAVKAPVEIQIAASSCSDRAVKVPTASWRGGDDARVGGTGRIIDFYESITM